MTKLWTDAEREALCFRVVRLKPGADDELPAGTEGVVVSLDDAVSSDGTIPEARVCVFVEGHDEDPEEDFGIIFLPVESLEVTDVINEEYRQAYLNPVTIRVSSKGEILGHYDEDGEFVPRQDQDD